MGAAFAAIGRFFTDLLSKIGQALEWFGKAFIQVFVDAWEMLTDLPVWLFDSSLGLAASALAEVPWNLPPVSNLWGGLPGEFLNVLGLLGLHYCMGLIVAALAVRFTLQLIPFVRLGS